MDEQKDQEDWTFPSRLSSSQLKIHLLDPFGATKNIVKQWSILIKSCHRLTPLKTTTWQWKITIFNRRYIFIHGCVSIVISVFRAVIFSDFPPPDGQVIDSKISVRIVLQVERSQRSHGFPNYIPCFQGFGGDPNLFFSTIVYFFYNVPVPPHSSVVPTSS